MSWLASACHGALDVLLGVRCLGCSAPGSTWCRECVDAAASPRTWQDGQLRITAACRYRDDVADAINAHKERGHLTLSAPLGLLLAAAVIVRVNATDPILMVPCPSSRRVVKARGHDHAARLAISAARWIHRSNPATPVPPQVAAVLQQRPGLRDQVGLSPTERFDNMRDAFVSRRNGEGRPVIIVDDITTSGATLLAAASALGGAGWSVRGAAVVADARA